MTRQILIGLFLLIVLCAGSTCAQTLENKIEIRQPDFSGTWNVDASRSKFDAFTSEALKERKNFTQQMIIEQNFPAVKITMDEKYEGSEKDDLGTSEQNTHIYYADGRGENEPIDLRVSTSQFVAKIAGGKLVITLYGLDDYNKKKPVFTSEYTLSNNGNTLVLKNKRIVAAKPKISGEEKFSNELLNSYLVFTRSK